MSKDIEGHVRAGSVEVKVNCDVSQLNDAISKMHTLIELSREAEARGLLPAGIAIAGIIGAARPISRRSLLGFGWKGRR